MPNFHYLPTLSRAEESWTGLRGYVQEPWPASLRSAPRGWASRCPCLRSIPALAASELNFDIYAYICGLNEMVSGVRELLTAFGWHKKQIVFERYD